VRYRDCPEVEVAKRRVVNLRSTTIQTRAMTAPIASAMTSDTCASRPGSTPWRISMATPT